MLKDVHSTYKHSFTQAKAFSIIFSLKKHQFVFQVQSSLNQKETRISPQPKQKPLWMIFFYIQWLKIVGFQEEKTSLNPRLFCKYKIFHYTDIFLVHTRDSLYYRWRRFSFSSYNLISDTTFNVMTFHWKERHKVIH